MFANLNVNQAVFGLVFLGQSSHVIIAIDNKRWPKITRVLVDALFGTQCLNSVICFHWSFVTSAEHE
jgi:hypothetical protein